MVFIRPQILMDPALQDSITNSKYNYIRSRQQLQRRTNTSLVPSEELPLLPEMYEFMERPEQEPPQQ
jgi:type II secretory pathway component GspD/PulD (secretin)